MQSYQEARTFAETGRSKGDRPIANNTRVQLRDNGDVAVRLHSTDVVTYHPDGSVTLDSGGWRTYTTKDRINAFSPARVWAERGVWEVHTGQDSARFFDGITIAPDGSLQEAKARRFAEAGETEPEEALRKRVNKYAHDFAEAHARGEIAHPGSGDCWGCLMVAQDGSHPMGGPDHVLSHMEEGYFVPSLLWNALKAKGYREPGFIWQMGNRRDIARAVRSYCLRELRIG